MAPDQKWKQTVDDGVPNAAWDEYDALIKTEIDEYNRRLASTTGYAAVDWKLCKAMVWVESGGPKNSAWRARAMQIGNPGDPGYAALTRGEGASGTIMSDRLKRDIAGNINDPKLNIRAGIAYLFNRLAISNEQSVADATDSKTFNYTVVAGDSLDRIAKKVGSTVAELQKLNPNARTLQPKQTIVCRKAAIKRVITGWRPFTTANVAAHYNGGRDPDYAAKLDYVLALLAKLKR